MEHKIFTPEQKQRAKNADLIEFFKKSIAAKQGILKYSKDFGGSLTDV